MAPEESLSSNMTELMSNNPEAEAEAANIMIVFILGIIEGALCLILLGMIIYVVTKICALCVGCCVGIRCHPGPVPPTLPLIHRGVIGRSEQIPDECVVCGGRILEGDNIILLPYCRHMFHAPCAVNCIQVFRSCPICHQFVDAGFAYQVGPLVPGTAAG